MPSRRRLLAALGATAFAGCTSDPGADGTGTDDPPPPASPTASPTRTPTRTPEPPETVTGTWSHDGANARATYHVPVSPPEPNRTVWSLSVAPSSVLLADGVVFRGGDDLRVYDAATGTRRATRPFEGAVSPTAVADGTLFATERRGDALTAHALVPGGDASWSRDGVFLRRVDGGTAFGVTADRGELLALDATDGSERWRLPAADVDATVTRFGDLAVGVDRAYVAGENDGSAVWLLALDRADGSVAWTGTAPTHGSAVTVADRVLSGGFYGEVRAWTRDGERAWTASATPPVLDVGAADGRAFVSAHGEHEDEPAVTVVADGEVVWTRDAGRIAALAEGVAFVDRGDRLLALDAASGRERWRRSFDGSVVRVLPLEEGVLVESKPGADERRLRLLA